MKDGIRFQVRHQRERIPYNKIQLGYVKKERGILNGHRGVFTSTTLKGFDPGVVEDVGDTDARAVLKLYQHVIHAERKWNSPKQKLR